MNFRTLTAVLLCGLMLCSCSKNDTTSQYVDVDSQDETENQTWVDISTEDSDFTYDDKPVCIMGENTTVDADYIYSFSMMPSVKIDLSTGEAENICEIAGCPHTEDVGCVNYQGFGSPVATSDGIYYIDGANLMLLSGGKEETVVTNDYYTEYEEEAHPDDKSLFCGLTIHGNLIYLVSPTYFRTYNLGTKELSEPKVVSGSSINNFAASDDYVYFRNESLEFYQYNLKTDELIKLDDKVGQTAIYDGKVYYGKWENYDGENIEEAVCCLYCRDIDGENPQKLIEGCYLNYVVVGNYVYYETFKASLTHEIFVTNLDDMSTTEVNLDYLEDADSSPYFIFTASNDSSRVLILDEMNSKLLVFEVGSAEYTLLDFGEE